MSSVSSELTGGREDLPDICEFCGGEIVEPEQDCQALFIGRCSS